MKTSKVKGKKEVESMTVEEWVKINPYVPVIVNEEILKVWLKNGLISEEQMKLLEEDRVVKIVGYWAVISRFLESVPIEIHIHEKKR